MDNTVLIDCDTIEELKMVLEDGLEDLIQTFLHGSEEILQTLKSQLLSLSHDEIANLCHTLKGSSHNVGAVKLADTCKALEVAAKEGKHELFDGLVTEIESCYSETKQALLEIVG